MLLPSFPSKSILTYRHTLREFLFMLRKILFLSLFFLFPAMGLKASDDLSPVVVELFTSQGCSSCPAAEEFFSTWGMNAFKKHQIIPLAFHVDYWDSLGWKDPFSSADATERQERYAAAFKSDSIYTPQMVVAGKHGFVGSDKKRAGETLARFANVNSALRIKINPSWKNGSIRFSVLVEQEEGLGKNIKFLVMAAIFENGLVTEVLRGENAGRTLNNDFVVRAFAAAGTFDPGASSKFSKTLELSWDPSWKKENSGLVVFLQNQETLETGPSVCFFPLNRLGQTTGGRLDSRPSGKSKQKPSPRKKEKN